MTHFAVTKSKVNSPHIETVSCTPYRWLESVARFLISIENEK